MRRILPPGDAPAWAHHLSRDIERALAAPAETPVRLPAFASAAALPPAARWPFGLAFVQDIATVADSTGSAWRRLDTGAIL